MSSEIEYGDGNGASTLATCDVGAKCRRAGICMEACDIIGEGATTEGVWYVVDVFEEGRGELLGTDCRDMDLKSSWCTILCVVAGIGVDDLDDLPIVTPKVVGGIFWLSMMFDDDADTRVAWSQWIGRENLGMEAVDALEDLRTLLEADG